MRKMIAKILVITTLVLIACTLSAHSKSILPTAKEMTSGNDNNRSINSSTDFQAEHIVLANVTTLELNDLSKNNTGIQTKDNTLDNIVIPSNNVTAIDTQTNLSGIDNPYYNSTNITKISDSINTDNVTVAKDVNAEMQTEYVTGDSDVNQRNDNITEIQTENINVENITDANEVNNHNANSIVIQTEDVYGINETNINRLDIDKNSSDYLTKHINVVNERKVELNNYNDSISDIETQKVDKYIDNLTSIPTEVNTTDVEINDQTTKLKSIAIKFNRSDENKQQLNNITDIQAELNTTDNSINEKIHFEEPVESTDPSDIYVFYESSSSNNGSENTLSIHKEVNNESNINNVTIFSIQSQESHELFSTSDESKSKESTSSTRSEEMSSVNKDKSKTWLSSSSEIITSGTDYDYSTDGQVSFVEQNTFEKVTDNDKITMHQSEHATLQGIYGTENTFRKERKDKPVDETAITQTYNHPTTIMDAYSAYSPDYSESASKGDEMLIEKSHTESSRKSDLKEAHYENTLSNDRVPETLLMTPISTDNSELTESMTRTPTTEDPNSVIVHYKEISSTILSSVDNNNAQNIATVTNFDVSYFSQNTNAEISANDSTVQPSDLINIDAEEELDQNISKDKYVSGEDNSYSSDSGNEDISGSGDKYVDDEDGSSNEILVITTLVLIACTLSAYSKSILPTAKEMTSGNDNDRSINSSTDFQAEHIILANVTTLELNNLSKKNTEIQTKDNTLDDIVVPSNNVTTLGTQTNLSGIDNPYNNSTNITKISDSINTDNVTDAKDVNAERQTEYVTDDSDVNQRNDNRTEIQTENINNLTSIPTEVNTTDVEINDQTAKLKSIAIKFITTDENKQHLKNITDIQADNNKLNTTDKLSTTDNSINDKIDFEERIESTDDSDTYVFSESSSSNNGSENTLSIHKEVNNEGNINNDTMVSLQSQESHELFSTSDESNSKESYSSTSSEETSSVNQDKSKTWFSSLENITDYDYSTDGQVSFVEQNTIETVTDNHKITMHESEHTTIQGIYGTENTFKEERKDKEVDETAVTQTYNHPMTIMDAYNSYSPDYSESASKGDEMFVVKSHTESYRTSKSDLEEAHYENTLSNDSVPETVLTTPISTVNSELTDSMAKTDTTEDPNNFIVHYKEISSTISSSVDNNNAQNIATDTNFDVSYFSQKTNAEISANDSTVQPGDLINIDAEEELYQNISKDKFVSGEDNSYSSGSGNEDFSGSGYKNVDDEDGSSFEVSGSGSYESNDISSSGPYESNNIDHNPYQPMNDQRYGHDKSVKKVENDKN